MKKATSCHSSVWIDGRLLTLGGLSHNTVTSRHEEFSFDEGVKERKDMPIPLKNHTATKFGHHKIIVCGGIAEKVTKTFFNI